MGNTSLDDRKLLINSAFARGGKPVFQLTWANSDGSNLHIVEVPPEIYELSVDFAGWLTDDTIYFGSLANGGLNTITLLDTNTLQWTPMATDVIPKNISFDSEYKEIIVSWKEGSQYGVDRYDFTGKQLSRFTSNTFRFSDDVGQSTRLFISPSRQTVLTHQIPQAGGLSGTIGLTNAQRSQVIWQSTQSGDLTESNPVWSADSTMFAFAVSTIFTSAPPGPSTTELNVFSADGTQRHQITVDTDIHWPNFAVGWSNCK